MKKLLLIVISLLLLTGCVYAEQVEVERANSDFNITMIIPSGYSMLEERIEHVLYVTVTKTDALPTDAYYVLSVAYSEIYDGQSITDMTDDEKLALIDIMRESYQNALVTEAVTKEGTPVYVLDENDSDSDYALAFTVYRGYFIQVFIAHDDFSTLEDGDLEMAIELLGDMQFVDP